MKKTLLLILIIACITGGCKLDDAGFKQNSVNTDTGGSNGVITASIVGMWFLKTQHTVGTALGIPVDDTTPGTVKDYYLFKADGTVDFSTADDGVVSGTYVYNATTKKVIITNPTDTSTFTINKLTATDMELFITVSVPALGTNVNVTTTFTH